MVASARADVVAGNDLAARIRSASNLPSPPAVAARLIQVADDPDLTMTDVVDVLRVDPALTAKLLRLANSPLYARRRRIETLQHAVTLLGLDAVVTAALSLTLLHDGSVTRGTSDVFRSQWTRSVYAAVAAQALASQCRHIPPPDAFLAGLMQDIGVLAITCVAPDVYLAANTDDHRVLIDLETAAFDTDHAAAGGDLLAAWNLPEHIVDAVRHSHDHVVDTDRPLNAIVAISGLIADAMHGDDAIMTTVRERAAQLGITSDALNIALTSINDAIPELAALLNATVPPPDRLAEMAAEMIMERMMTAQANTIELRDQFQHAADTASRLVEQNRLDPLTGQLNRRNLDAALDEHMHQWARFGWPFAILFIDIDDFKFVNDTFGHRAGDDTLSTVARTISQQLRHGDLIGRYGGDEFVVILPAATLADATVVAERLVGAARAQHLQMIGERTHQATISIGVAATDAHPHVHIATELLDIADHALYEAKRLGRDRWAT